MPRGSYERVSTEELARRDKELEKAGMMPTNPKRKAAAYRKLMEMKHAKVYNTKTEEKPKKIKEPKAARKAPEKKAKKPAFVSFADAVVPKLKPGRKPRVVNDTPSTWEVAAREERVAKDNLDYLCHVRGNLGEFASDSQHQRFSALIDWALTRYQNALQQVNPSPVKEGVKEDSAPEPVQAVEPEEEEEPEVLEAVPPPPPVVTAPAQTSLLPQPPPPPPLPPFYSKPSV